MNDLPEYAEWRRDKILDLFRETYSCTGKQFDTLTEWLEDDLQAQREACEERGYHAMVNGGHDDWGLVRDAIFTAVPQIPTEEPPTKYGWVQDVDGEWDERSVEPIEEDADAR